MPSVKETRFFDLEQNFAKGIDWYSKFFLPGLNKGARVFGEASPGYFHFPNVPERLHTTIPKAKLILILRDPVERAYSHYWNRVRGGHENRRFVEVVEAHLEGRKKEIVLEVGHYVDHLERFYIFYPPEQIQVVFTNNMASDPLLICQKIFTFLEIDTNLVPNNLDTKINAASLVRSRFVHSFLTHQSPIKRIIKGFVPAPLWLQARQKLRRLNYKRFSYPSIETEIELLLQRYYREFDQRLASKIGPLPWLP